MKTTAGRRDRRVKVQRPVEARDSYGEPLPSWKTVCERWAAVRPLRGREAEQARAIVATVTHRVEMHHVEGVIPKWRLQLGSRTLNIDYVANVDGRGEELELLVTEQV